MAKERIDMSEKLEAWLEEFRALRDEIVSQGRLYKGLLTLNAIFLGVIVSLYEAQSDNMRDLFVLLIPFISSSLGIFFIDLHISITMHGKYIQEKIMPAVRELCGDPKLMGWEEEAHKVSDLFYALPAFLFFGIPSLTCLVIGGGRLHASNLPSLILFIFGILCTGLFLGGYIYYVKPGIKWKKPPELK